MSIRNLDALFAPSSILPLDPDLAVISTPPQPVPGLIAALGDRGCRAVIVITAGFGEGDQARGQELMQPMLDAARPSLLRIVGPNCLGVMAPHAGINASFAHLAPLDGDIAFVTQSGAVATSVRTDMKDTGLGYGLMSQILEYARSTGIGRVFGDVLKENDRMLRMAREFGFAVLPAEEGSDTVSVEISLATPAADAASAHARSLRRRRE